MQASVCWRNQIITRLEVRGHAPARHPELCNALSCLLRSGAEALHDLETQGLKTADWNLELGREGHFCWGLQSLSEQSQGPLHDLLRGVSLMLACGLRHLAAEFPDLELCEHVE